MKMLKAGLYVNFAALGYGIFNNYYDLGDRLKTKAKQYNPEDFSQKLEEFVNRKDNNKYFAQPLDRKKAVEDLSQKHYNLLIIGGGSAGAGVLLDAYSRGLSSALIESNDFASGTSSKSTKLAHGGIRYLEEAMFFQIKPSEAIYLLREALYERDFFLNSAPFMNKRVEIQAPARNFLEMNYFYLGFLVYHFFYFITNFPNLFYIFNGPKIYLSNKNEKVCAKYYAGWYEGQFWDARQNLLSIITCGTDGYYKGKRFNLLIL